VFLWTVVCLTLEPELLIGSWCRVCRVCPYKERSLGTGRLFLLEIGAPASRQ